jgi:hydrogenase maturation factor
MSKLPYETMRRFVFSRTGQSDPDVICGPALGEDAAVIRMNGDILVAHADPIVGAVKHIGRLSVHIACNDIAVRGVRPRWIMPVIILPESHTQTLIDEITGDVHSAALEIGAAVVGGHLGYAAGLDRPLIATSAFGATGENGYVLTRTAGAGDLLLVTRGAGIEGTAILAFDFANELRRMKVSEELILEGRKMMAEISVVEECLVLFGAGVTAMHDATRGGILEAVIEIAAAADLRAEIREEHIPIRDVTRVFADHLKFDPLRLIGSGAVVATVPPDRLSEVDKGMKRIGVPYAVIGELSEGGGVILHRREPGRFDSYDRPHMEDDELAALWRRFRK